MGNKSDLGYIKTNKTVYQGGDTIFGEFYLKCIKDQPAERIIIRIIGIESAEWEELQAGAMRLFKSSKIILKHEVDLFRFPFCKLEKGDYIFPFIIELPPNIPTSTSFSLPRLKGSITYTLETILLGTNISASSTIKILSPLTQEPSIAEIYTKLKGCLWIDRGEVYLRAKTENESCTTESKLRVYIDVDVTRSSWAVGTIEVNVMQTISVKSDQDGKKHLRKQSVYAKNFPVIASQFGFELGLQNFQKDVMETNSTCGKIIEVGYSVEIRGIMESIFSAYGEEPQLTLWFSIHPKNEEPKMPKYNFSWKPKIIENSFRNSIPIYS